MKSTAPIALAALALCLSACGGDSTDSPSSSGGDDATAAAPPQESATSDEAPAWQDEDDPALRTQGCLAGEFVLDDDVWVSSIADLLTASDLTDVQVDVAGRLTLTLDTDGGYVVTGEDQRTTSSGASPGGQLLWTMTFDGAESGTWASTAAELALTTGDAGRLAADQEISIDGNPLPTGTLPVSDSPWSDTLTVTCDADGFVTKPADDPEAPDVAFRRVG